MGTESILPVLSNLGIGGFAIYIMWRMFDANQKEREAHRTSAQVERDKYMIIVTDTHRAFNSYQEKVQTDVMLQLGKNTDALTQVLNHFSRQ